MQAVSKLEQLKSLMVAGYWHKAISLASKFHELGDHKTEITRAQAAITNPSFYRQLGQDPDAIVSAGIEALKARYAKYFI